MRTCIALLFINLGYRRNRNRVKEWMNENLLFLSCLSIELQVHYYWLIGVREETESKNEMRRTEREEIVLTLWRTIYLSAKLCYVCLFTFPVAIPNYYYYFLFSFLFSFQKILKEITQPISNNSKKVPKTKIPLRFFVINTVFKTFTIN